MPHDDLNMTALPLEARERYDAIPMFPTRADFQSAMSIAENDPDPVAIWHREAMRWRLANEGRPLDLQAIAAATAEAMQKLRNA